MDGTECDGNKDEIEICNNVTCPCKFDTSLHYFQYFSSKKIQEVTFEHCVNKGKMCV